MKSPYECPHRGQGISALALLERQAIFTSTGQNDSGMFETNLHDERYLPFENSGIVSEWQLELPADVRQFDYDTISDVILHVRYTAHDARSPGRKLSVLKQGGSGNH